MEKIILVVSCYKRDYFLVRPCVASIRYYYPEVEVYLLKDYLGGEFDSSELEQAFEVKNVDLGIRKFGWGSAKVHFILSQKFAGQRVVLIDSDTVLTGRFLEELYRKTQGIDFVVDPEYYQSPYEGNVPLHYYKFDDIKAFDPDFIFPGYVFNTGQMLVTPGKVTPTDIAPFFDPTAFPYYKRLDILPQVDQSILNYILPKMAQQGRLTLAAEPNLMAWSDGPVTRDMDLEKIKQGNSYASIVHWAGTLRISHLAQMTRPDILLFFEDYYYSKVPMGSLKKRTRRTIAASDYHLRNLYRSTLKPLLKR